jgi:hypothetical protein
VDASGLVIGRLVVRRANDTKYGSIVDAPSAASLVNANPPFPFAAALSGDGQYLFVRPTGFLRPSTNYSVRMSGAYTTGGVHLVTGAVGATGGGTFGDTIHFRTRPLGGPLPLRVGARRVSAFNLRRLAIPEPAFLPSVNQIGFDSYDFLVGTVGKTRPGANGEGSVLLWVAGAHRNSRGRHVIDPARSFAFSLLGRYRGTELIMSGQNVPLTFSFGDVAVQLLQFRGHLTPSLRMLPGNFLFAEVFCPDVPTYGPLLVLVGLCNKQGKLEATGTYLTSGYERRGTANRRPHGVKLASVTLQRPTDQSDGSADARLSVRHGVRYPARSHVAAILLTDAASGQPVSLDYRRDTTMVIKRGRLAGAHLRIPAGTSMPARVRAYVLTDVFPLGRRDF